MKIETKFLGEVEVSEQDIYTFDSGLLGFPEQTKYALFPLDADLPITVLQSIEDAELGFILAFPFAFKKDYAFDLSIEDKEHLQIDKEEDVLVYSIVTLNDSFDNSTINLLAPVVINVDKKIGKQIVLHDSALYPLRYAVKEFANGVK